MKTHGINVFSNIYITSCKKLPFRFLTTSCLVYCSLDIQNMKYIRLLLLWMMLLFLSLWLLFLLFLLLLLLSGSHLTSFSTIFFGLLLDHLRHRILGDGYPKQRHLGMTKVELPGVPRNSVQIWLDPVMRS